MTALVAQSMAAPAVQVGINWNDPKMIETVKRTVAKDATDEELTMFIEICKATGLNPFKKEIWFVKGKDGRLQIMTGINGYFTVANRHPMYDGLEADVEFDAKGIPTKAYCKVFRKDRSRPSVGVAYFREFVKPNQWGKEGTWEKMPGHMLLKIAKAISLREAFTQELGGTYTSDEMPSEYQEPVNVTPLRPVETPKKAETVIVEAQLSDGEMAMLASNAHSTYQIETPKSSMNGRQLGDIWIEDRSWFRITKTPNFEKLVVTDRNAILSFLEVQELEG